MTLRVTTIGALLLGIAACSNDPTGYEMLSTTRATAQAAVDVVTTGQDTIPSNCGGSTPKAMPTGPIDRVQIVVDVVGLENADMALTGAVGCTLADAFLGVFVGTLQASLAQNNLLCGAPGPALFVRCRD